MRKILYFLFILSLLAACSDKKGQDSEFVTLPIGESVNISVDESSNLKINNYSIIPLETTDSSLLSSVDLYGELNDKLVLTSDNRVYFFLKDGRFDHKFDKQGGGSNEYLSINDIAINKPAGLIYIHDFSRRMINTYTEYGEFVNSIRNDSIASLKFDKNNHFVVTYSPSEQWEYQVGIYDTLFNSVGVFLRKPQKVEGATLFTINSICNFDDDNYVYISDTLYRIKSNSVEPYVAIDKGSLKLPFELEHQISNSGDRNKYIWGEYGYLVGDYYFLSYYYNGNTYYDVWSVSDEKLLLRNTVSFDDDTIGIPVLVGDKTVYLWPKAVIDSSVYFLIGEEKAPIIIPERSEEDNPVIIMAHAKDIEIII